MDNKSDTFGQNSNKIKTTESKVSSEEGVNNASKHLAAKSKETMDNPKNGTTNVGETVKTTAESESSKHSTKSNIIDLEASRLGKAIHAFGTSLKRTAIILLILDLASLIIVMWENNSIKFTGRFSYDRFGVDFYTTISRELAETNAWLETVFNMQNIAVNASYYITGLVINITVLAIVIGCGIRGIGLALAEEKSKASETLSSTATN